MTPRDVDDCSIWQFRQALEGWRIAQGGEPSVEAPTTDDFDEMVRQYGG